MNITPRNHRSTEAEEAGVTALTEARKVNSNHMQGRLIF